MRKLALVFVLAVLAPSLVLAWLAVRSVHDQQFVLERQQSLLFQGVADSLAREAQDILNARQEEFGQLVETMLAESGSHTDNLARSFDDRLRVVWPAANVGFVVTLRGDLVCPPLNCRAEAQEFRDANSRFLASSEQAEVYWNAGNFQKAATQSQVANSFSENSSTRQNIQVAAKSYDQKDIGGAELLKNVQSKAPLNRAVRPQQILSSGIQTEQAAAPQASKVAPSETEFRQLIGESPRGTLARFVDNKLNVLVWYRPPRFNQYVFGAELDLSDITRSLQSLVDHLDASLRTEICAAILNDFARPVALSHPGFQANWKRPFVATEVGEMLPHWEVGVYLLDPVRLTTAAQTLRWTLGLLIALLVATIAVGGWLIVTDLKRQLALARQKTDFVSNVSHELKTPLTSIRMFSELLSEGRVADPEKQRSYLQIISAEAARLTRLIENVLDFARLERGEKKYHFKTCDLASVIRGACETYRPHLEEAGFHFVYHLPEGAIPVSVDPDALAQVVVNLLSNAEKYSGTSREIEVITRRGPEHAAVDVLDRGVGVPSGSEEKIFEKFYRAHDSLGSGIQGAGLGLTLSRQIAEAHGGSVTCIHREGGGSCFTLRLPLLHRELKQPAS
jgi:signal transduction histidine kinase